MSAVLTSPPSQPSIPVVTRAAIVRCTRCGVSRPAGHVHCYACGAKLGMPSRASWSRPLHAFVRAAAATMRRFAPARHGSAPSTPPPFTVVPPPPHAMPFGQRPLKARSRFDRFARWYMALSLAAVGVWYVATPHTIPTAAASPSEACTWLDTQRAQLTAEAGRLAEPYRPTVAQRLADLAGWVGQAGAR